MPDTQVGATVSLRAQTAVESAIAASAWRIERWISRGRLVCFSAIIIYSAIWIKILTKQEMTLSRSITYYPMILGMVFSLYVLVLVRQPPRGQGLWLLAVFLDILTGYAALVEVMLWHGPSYAGFLWLPETSGVHIATMAAGLRHSVRAAIGGGIASVAGMVTLLSVDSAFGVDNGVRAIAMYSIFTLAATIVAVIIAASTRSVVLRASDVAVRAERAERGLGAVLADCHDARSFLTSLRLNVDSLTSGPSESGAPTAAKVAENLRDGLGRVEQLVMGVNMRALEDLAATKQAAPVALKPAVYRVLRHVRERYPAVQVHAAEALTNAVALVAGGDSALERVLLNLMSNACEGDGFIAPTEVGIAVLNPAGSPFIKLRVEDNGPGFRDAICAEPMTTKPGGFGVGLKVIRGICEASGGYVRFQAREGGGTVAEVRLPAA